VHLATQNLLEGIKNGDKLWNLQERFRKLPKSLIGFYDKILSSIADEYRKDIARSLLFISDDERDLHFTPALSMVNDREREQILALETLDMIEWNHVLWRTEGRLVDQCKGLVEVFPAGKYERDGMTSAIKQMILGRQAVFAHRTISDFLQSADIRTRLLQRAEIPSTLPDLKYQVWHAHLHATMCHFSHFPGLDDELRKIFVHSYNNCVRARRQIDRESRLAYWERLRKLMTKPWDTPKTNIIYVIRNSSPFWVKPTGQDAGGIAFVVYAGVPALLQRELDQQSEQRPEHGMAASTLSIELYCAMLPWFRLQTVELADVLEIVELLLRHGADPNEKDPQIGMQWWLRAFTVPWEQYCQLNLHGQLRFQDNLEARYPWVEQKSARAVPKPEVLDLVLCFLRHGADPNARIRILHKQNGTIRVLVERKAIDALRDMFRDRDIERLLLEATDVQYSISGLEEFPGGSKSSEDEKVDSG